MRTAATLQWILIPKYQSLLATKDSPFQQVHTWATAKFIHHASDADQGVLNQHGWSAQFSAVGSRHVPLPVNELSPDSKGL